MNKFVISVLALSATSSLAIAGSETKEWSGLDRDIENLASSLATPGPGYAVNGFFRGSIVHSGDTLPEDTLGTVIDNARINFTGNAGDYGIFISAEGYSPTSGVLDAYATFPIGGQISGRLGQFRPPFLWSALIDENNMILLNRTMGGSMWSFRDNGVSINGAFEQLNWWIGVQNGIDGTFDEHAFSGRLAFNALGTGVGMQEGAYGASADSNLTIGVGLYDDGGGPSTLDFSAMCADAAFTRGGLSAHLELVDQDTGFGDNTPWSATVGYMFTPNEWEVAGRFEDADDLLDTTVITVGVNRYIQGHNAKWGLNFASQDQDPPGADFDAIALGVTVGV
jgi:hypothetical protein